MDKRKKFPETYPYWYAARQRQDTYEAAILLAEPYQIDHCLGPTQVGYGFCVLYPPPLDLLTSLAEKAHRLWWLLTDISRISEGLRQNQEYFIELGIDRSSPLQPWFESADSKLLQQLARQYGVLTPPIEEMYGQLMVELSRELLLVGMPFFQIQTRIAEIDLVHSKIDISVWDFTAHHLPISTGPLDARNP